MKIWDISIIGAGPGGTSAAKSLSSKGFDTIIFEKDKLPRYKVCGGAIPQEFVEQIKLPDEIIDRKFDFLTLHHSNGKIIDRKGKGACLWRSKLDNHLTKLAIEDGATLKDATKIIDVNYDENKRLYCLKTKKEEFLSKILIISDGVPSILDQKFNFPKFPSNYMAQTITHEIEFDSKKMVDDRFGDNLHLWFGKEIVEIGYAWIFPKTKVVSVGWGCQINVLKNIREKFENFLNIVKDLIKGGKTIKKAAHMVPVGIRRKFVDEKGLIAIGDAAGFVDPLSGKGIAYAALSGYILGNVVKKALESNELQIIPQKFEKKLNREFLSSLKEKGKIKEDVYKNNENIVKFLELWKDHRSTEIASKLWKLN
ncbi:MAG: NAD(P)/FAD-dependent oxidoreductase [Candidatus Lokiarchaeota archaeon]|nr:NAD(P)/FAD-dependent oxidoreductase [Candidatus Lokiarchaeota archaeon]